MEDDKAAVPHAGDQEDPVAELEVRTSMRGDLSVSSHGAGAKIALAVEGGGKGLS